MSEKISDDEFHDAIEQTRIKEKVREALFRIMVKGEKISVVAHDMDISRQALYAAKDRVETVIAQQQVPPGCRMVKVWLPYEQADKIEQQCRKRQLQNVK